VAASGGGGRKRPASSRGDGAAAARITWSEEATTLFLSLLVESKEARARYQERYDNKKLRLLKQSIVDKFSAVQPGVPFTVARLQNKIKKPRQGVALIVPRRRGQAQSRRDARTD